MILKCLFVSFIVQNFKEVLRADLELLRIRGFRKSSKHNFHVPLGLFHCVKKSLQQIQSCKDAQFFVPKWPNSSK